MAQIFFSYKSSDKDRVRPLVKLFEAQGWTVWWDRKIPAGKTFDEVIEEAVKAAACIVVVWSKDSVQSRWVKNEAAEGAKRDILVPVLIDDVEPPFEFRRVQAAKLLQLDDSTRDDPEFRNLIASVSDILQGTTRGRQSQGQSQSQIMRAIRLDKESREARKGGPDTPAAGPAKSEKPIDLGRKRRLALALGGGLLVCAAAALLVHFVGPAHGHGAAPAFNGSVTFIGVEADADDAKADQELISYLKREVASQPRLTFSQQTYAYDLVVEKLAGWSPKDGAFLARTTPYVYVAAEMEGADLEVLATYRSKATKATTYRSYFVVNRADFPKGPPTLDELVSFLKQKRRSFIYHSQFSTSSYFLPSLFFHQHHIFHMDQSTDALWAIDAAEIPTGSSTELVRRVARNEANLAAVWDGTRVKFERDDPSFQEANAPFAGQVYFIPIDTPLPNDLLVCSAALPTAVKDEIHRAVGEMTGKPLIGIGDFEWWENFRQAKGAPEALATLRWAAAKAAIEAPGPVTVDVQQADEPERQVPASYLEAAKQAIRLSGTEFAVYDPEFHRHVDFIWKLALAHDGTVLLTSRIKGYSGSQQVDLAPATQEYWISFADEAELAGRINTFIHSRMHRIRYLWPFAADTPTLIRDVGFSLVRGTPVTVQQIVWEDLARNQFSQRGDLEARIDTFDAHKIALKFQDLSAAAGGFKVDPLSNQVYRVILARSSDPSTFLVALSYLFVALLVLAAVGTVVDLRRRRKHAPAAASPPLRLIGTQSPAVPDRIAEVG